MAFVNLTSHGIHDLDSGLKLPAGTELRTRNVRSVVRIVDNVKVFRTSIELRDALPEAKPDTIYIVSALALNVIPEERVDFVCPGNVVREDNKVIGCRGFRCN